MEKLINELKDRIPDELEDVHEYHELADIAEEHGHPTVAHYLRVIAHEENTHAEYLKHAVEKLEKV